MRLLSDSCDAIPHEKSELLVAGRDETKAVVAIREDARGVFVHPFEKDSPLISAAKLFGSDFHEHSVEEAVEKLSKAKSEDVWLQCPSGDPSTVPGHVFSISAGGVLRVYLAPVPKNIETVNEWVHAVCAEKCPRAKAGLRCGECRELATCEIIGEVDESLSKGK